MSDWSLPLGEPLHSPRALAVLVGLLADDGIDPSVALADTGLVRGDLEDGLRRTSIAQYLTACRNAMTWSGDGALALRLGARLPLADLGPYALLLLASSSVREVFRLAVRYQWLALPVVAIEVVEGPNDLRWIVADEALRDVPDDLRAFVVARQFAQQVAHLKEVAGDACGPALACFAHAAPPQAARYAAALGCPCVFDRPRFELRYGGEAVTLRPRFADPRAAAVLQATCDELIADVQASLGFAGQVYRTLRRMRDPGARMKVVASELRMTDRTLRRRLADEGTCFSTISLRTRIALATQHLKASATRIDEIAAITGFSDPANFRRAFIRWTNMSPARYRRLEQG